MARSSYGLILAILFAFSGYALKAQKAESKPDVKKAYEQRVRDLVSFLQYMLNTVGDQSSSARDKEVIISESYQKIFRDEDVQVEDDLLTDRLVATNKDVTAYLKDVDFFFQHISFDFQIVSVEAIERSNDEWSFKVETNRTMKGRSLEGQEVLDTQKRFIEVNLDRDKDDLKIASIYTTGVNREKALRAWWSSLSFEWMSVFTETAGISLNNEPTVEDLIRLASIDSLNLRDNRLIADINPVEALLDLKFLDLTNTRVADLTPLRGLSELSYLSIASTNVDSIEFLRYASRLKVLDLSSTAVTDLTILSQLEGLEELYLNGIPATDFSPISRLNLLRRLDVSFTGFGDPQVLAGHSQLQFLNISYTGTYGIEAFSSLNRLKELLADQTFIPNLEPLSTAKDLEILSINETPVASLKPLEPLPNLQRVYCDNTSVTDKQADEFMAKKKGTLVIINSRQLQEWWSGLSGEWHMALLSELKLARGQKPTKEQLVSLTKRDSLSLINRGLRNLSALAQFKNLRYLDISKNPVISFESLAGLQNLQTLKANDTPTDDLSPMRQLKDLVNLELVNTRVFDLEPLMILPKLSFVNLDDTFVSQGSVLSLLQANPACIVIYQTKVLQEWWSALTPEWKEVFAQNAGLTDQPGAIALHQLVSKVAINAAGHAVETLEPLYKFLNLEELNISGSGITHLSEVQRLNHLKVLDCSKNPLADITPLRELVFLEVLNVSNTAVEDLRQIDNLTSLKTLICAGTQLKNLKGIERFSSLKEIDFSNTKVRRLDRLIEIRTLESLVCFNTRISSREISDFRKERPECEVTYY